MRFLRFLIVAQLAAASVAAFTVDEDDKGASVATDATTTTTAGGAKTTTTAKGAATTTTSTTAKSAATTTPTTAKPAGPVLKPAAAGQYDYRIQYIDDEDTEETTGGFSRGNAREVEGEIRQTELEVDGETTTTTSYAWRADGLYLRSSTEDGATCNIEPDLLLAPSPLTVGREWRIDSSCTTEGETLRVQGTSRVARTERITVAGQSIEVHVIETEAMVDEGGSFRSKEYFSLAHGLVVRDDTTYDDGTREVTELLNVVPKPG